MTRMTDDDVAATAELEAMALVPAPGWSRRLARWLTAAVALLPVALIFVPWMQTFTGSGKVIAYSPIERQQRLGAPIDGFVVDYFGRRENELVRKGEPVFRLTDADPHLATRIEEQLEALRAKAAYTSAKIENYGEQITLFEFARNMTLEGAEFAVEMARNKISGARQNLTAAEADFATQKQIHDRTERLFKDPLHLASKQDWEIAEFKMREAAAKLEKARAELAGAENESRAKQSELEQKRGETNAKIIESRAKREDARSDLASIQKELRELETKRAQLERGLVKAPIDGRILRVERALDTDFVKKGDTVIVLVPLTDDPAVELWVDGNDIPLLAGLRSQREAEGKHVAARLQFEGWPAVQFAGWPSVAIGTFGGIVQWIDATDNGQGKFRVLVVPDPADQVPWPGRDYLRQGVKANGWLLINQVPLGWEMWRRLNGFPPAIHGMEADEKDGPEIYKRKK